MSLGEKIGVRHYLIIGNERCTLLKINANFPKVRFTYIKLKRNVRKQCAPNCILHEFAASMQTSQHTYRKEKIAPFP